VFVTAKLREGTYFPDDIVSKWSRCDTALASCICDMWTLGISNRKVEKALSELGVEKISRSRVSRLVKSLDEEVDDLRHGSLSLYRVLSFLERLSYLFERART